MSTNQALEFAWQRVKADPLTILGTLGLGMLVVTVTTVATGFMGNGGADWENGHRVSSLHALPALMMSVMLAVHVVNAALMTFVFAGMTKFSLHVARGEPYSIRDLWSEGRAFLPLVGLQAITFFPLMLGFFLLVIPGVILSLGLSMSMPLIVDKQMGPVQAILESWRLTDGYKWELCVFSVVALLLTTVSAMCVCGIGFIVVVPVVQIAWVYLYLKLTGQPVARAFPAA